MKHSFNCWKSWCILEISQDGGVKGHGFHLPIRTCQKYIYLWSKCYWKLTGNWEKDYCTNNQGWKKGTHVVGQEAKKSDWVGNLYLGHAGGKGRFHRWTPTLGREWVKPQTGCPTLGSYKGRWVPLAHWRTSGITGAWHWIWGSHNWEYSTVRCRGNRVPGQSPPLVLTWAANQKRSTSLTADTRPQLTPRQHRLESAVGASLRAQWLHNRPPEARVSDWLCGKRGLGPKTESEWREVNHSRHRHRTGIPRWCSG